MACPECEVARKQYLDARRMASLLAQTSGTRKWWFRRGSKNPSVTELLHQVGQYQTGGIRKSERRIENYPSWRLVLGAASFIILLTMVA